MHVTRFPMLFLIPLLACSSSNTGPLFVDNDAGVNEGGTSGSGGPSLLDGSAANPLATGTIVFSLDGRSYEIPGFARVHGQGNLELPFADRDNTGELRIGQGTYNGPATYVFSSQLRRGSFDLEAPAAKYNAGDRSASAATTCTVVVTLAPSSMAPPPGSEVRGTFTCSAVRRFPKSGNNFADDSDGSFDLTNGAFAFVVR